MFKIILFEPEIPPNTGNIIRLSVNTGFDLHLVKPLGFSVDDKSLKRAGMDYIKRTHFKVWESLDECLNNISVNSIYSVTTKGKTRYTDINFKKETLLFLDLKVAAYLERLEKSINQFICRCKVKEEV